MKTLIGRISVLSETIPDKAALLFKKECLTYSQLNTRIENTANILKNIHGIKENDKVCFSALSKPEMIVIYLGIQLAGGIAVFLDKNAAPENILRISKDADASLLITDKPMKDYAPECNTISMKELYAGSENVDETEKGLRTKDFAPDENDLAELLFTTGTTGKAKGVMLNYKSVYNILSNTIEGIGIREDDVMLLPLPLNHSFALRVLRAVLYKGGAVVLQNGFTFAKAVEENIKAFGCTAMACVPASYEIMKSQMQEALPEVLGHLRYIEFGAGSLSIKQRRVLYESLPGVRIYNTWGSSESGGAIFCDVTACVEASFADATNPVIGSLGRPLPERVEVEILDNAIPVGELYGNIGKYFIGSSRENPGRIAIKGEMQMAGYWNNPDATAETLVDGWLLTGDIGYLDAEGNVYMLGRADDIINVGGEKVSPIEVENIAGQYEFIKECACIGVEDPDGITGQIPVLFVVTKTGYEEAELIKFITVRIEKYKLPQRFVKLTELPRNSMQKIDRNKLKVIWEDKVSGKNPIINPVIETILSRRSIRKFTDKAIPEDILEALVKCAYYAPSGHNMQTWRFTVLTDESEIEKLKASAKEAASSNGVNFYGWENPKALIIVSNDTRNTYGCQDASCAAENIMLAAHSLGLGSVWLNPLMTLRDVTPVREVMNEFGIPANHTVWATIALGYPAADGTLLKKKENVVCWR